MIVKNLPMSNASTLFYRACVAVFVGGLVGLGVVLNLFGVGIAHAESAFTTDPQAYGAAPEITSETTSEAAPEALSETLSEAASETPSVELSDDEMAYIAAHPRVSIAMDASWTPYAYVDEATDEVSGVLVNLLDAVCAPLGIEPVYLAKSSYSEALQAVREGETNLVSGIADDQAMADKNGLLRTSPYININYCAVSKGNIPDLFVKGALYRIAVCTGSYATMAMREYMPSYEFVEYLSNDECMNAVETGEVDVALIASYSADYYVSDISYSNLNSTLIGDFSWGLCFGANQNTDPMLLSILNKGIAALTPNDVNQAVYLGMVEAALHNHSWGTWFERNQFALFLGTAIFATTVFAVIVFYQRRKSRILREQRDTDGLTGLLNRFAFERAVETHLGDSNQAAGFVILDLDEFKRINDAYGHAAGDEVLREVAIAIKHNALACDYLARLGGDEFVIFASGCDDLASVAKRVEVLLAQIAAIKVPEYEEISISASAGIAEYPADGETFIELYRNADQALYRAKKNGKGSFARY